MKKLLLFISAVCTSLATFAQDYYPIKRNDIYYFSSSSEILPLKIDSVKIEGKDSVYYLKKQLRYSSQLKMDGSWLGDSIRISPDGSCVFGNKFHKSFLLKTKATLNEKWIAFETTKWKAELTLNSITKESVLNISDSVKTFTINIIKQDGSDTTHPYDGLELKIGKNTGFVSLLNFYIFGVNQNEISLAEDDQKLIPFILTGSEIAKFGTINITEKEIYEFNVGDVFHVQEYKYQQLNSYDKYTSDSIISKSINDVTFEYIYKSIRKTKIDTLFRSTTYYLDTVEIRHSFNKGRLSNLPRMDFTDSKMNVVELIQLNYSDLERARKYLKEYYYKTPDNFVIHADGACTSNMYIKGLGGPYYECKWNDFRASWGTRLVYYKKGNEEWGIPLILGTSEEETFPSQITVSPNPAKDYVNFDFGSTKEPQNVQIFDLTGKIILSQIASDKAEVNLSGFKKGIYFYTVSSNSGKGRFSGKIIVE